MNIDLIEEEYDDELDELLNKDTMQCFYFYCDDILYAIPALKVIEIIEYQPITKAPLLDKSVLGITNIRGSIVGIVDLKAILTNTISTIDKKSSLIVIDMVSQNGQNNIAILVDEIFEVDGLDHNSSCEVPVFGTKVKHNFLDSIARYNGDEVYILDIDKVLDITNLSQVNIIQNNDNDEMFTREVKQKKYKNSMIYEDDDEENEEDITLVNNTSNNDSDISQYLIFEGPSKQLYGSNISKVKLLTPMEEFVINKNFDEGIITGTINMRGEIITVVNFDRWLGIKEMDEKLYTELIILNIGNYKVGLMVRSTNEIISINSNLMQSSSDADIKSTSIANIILDGKEHLCTIIDSDKILTDIFASISQKSDTDFQNLKKLDFDKTILFADDSSLIRNSIKKMANKLEIKYNIFENGKLLYDYMIDTDENIGLIVTDLEMPIMDGKELIKNITKKYDTKIIVYSNMLNTVLERELLDMGATLAINKIDVKSLSEAIRGLI